MASGLSERLWEMDDLVKLVDDQENKEAKQPEWA